MHILFVLLIAVTAIFLLSLVRVGGFADYSDTGLLVKLKLGIIRVTLYPPKKRKKKPQTLPEKAQKKPEPKVPSKGGELTLLKRFLPLISETAGRFKRKIRVDLLEFDLIVAAPDPALAALAFGGANAMLGLFIPLLENHFNIKDRRVRTRVDFNQTSPTVYLKAAFSLTVGQGVVLAARLAVQTLKITSQHKSEQQQKEAV